MLVIIGILSCLLLMLWQDWKFRRIHVLLPVLVFALSMAHTGFNLKLLSVNALFFITVFLLLVLYMSLKAKKLLNPFEHYFGLGDVLFYLAVTPLFLVKEYAVYFISSMVFALMMHWFFSKFYQHKEVPLAGFSSLFLGMIITIDLVFNFQKITLV